MRRCFLLLLALVVCGCAGDDVVGPVNDHGAFVQLTAGTSHTCGVTTDGTAFCWGNGDGGQLGTGRLSSSSVPLQVARSLQFVRLSAGAAHTCGVTVDGVVACWGDNTRGQLGNASVTGQGAPVETATAVRFASVANGWFHSCAVTAAGAVYCWGANGQGQAGIPERADILSPRALPTALRMFSITSGGFHSCGLRQDGVAYCWGANTFGQLGDGTTSDHDTPLEVAGGTRFQMLSAGYTHTCGITQDQRTLCWGSSSQGEMGTGGISGPGLPGARTPQQVGGPTVFERIAAGYYSTCAISTGREVWCWGSGDDGQLGNGGTRDEYLPTRISNGDLTTYLPFNEVTLGATHGCAVAVSAYAYCWGRGEHGELGAGALLRSPLAVRVITE